MATKKAYINVSWLAYKVREARGDKSIREAAKEIGVIGPSTLRRIEGGKGDQVNVIKIATVIKWAGLELDDVIHYDAGGDQF